MAEQNIQIQDVAKKLLKLRQTLAAAFTRIVKKYVSGWKSRVAVRRGWFKDAIDFREVLTQADFREVLISTDKDKRVTYSDVFERGRKDGANYSGRFPLGLTLEDEHERIETEIDKAVFDALGK